MSARLARHGREESLPMAWDEERPEALLETLAAHGDTWRLRRCLFADYPLL